MTFIREGGSKDIGAATLAQFQALTQLCHTQGKVTDGDVGLCDTGKGCAQLTLVHGCYSLNAERTTRKVGYYLVTDEKMTVRGQLAHTVNLGYLSKATGLHDRGVRLIKELGGEREEGRGLRSEV